MKLKPLADRVVLKQNAAEERTSSGIFLTASAQEKPEVYEVVEVGPGGMVDGNWPLLSDSIRRKLQWLNR